MYEYVHYMYLTQIKLSVSQVIKNNSTKQLKLDMLFVIYSVNTFNDKFLYFNP